MANYSLQIISPITSGSTPDVGKSAISSSHRIFWAYPGIVYNIQAAVIGGVYPYTYSLTSGVPGDMAVNSSTGEITWTAPSPADGTSYGPITLSVTDAENTTVTSSWTVTVDSTKFYFIDADAANGGTGTLASPFNEMSDLVGASINKIVYLRASTPTYHFHGFSYGTGGTLGFFRRFTANTNSLSCQWIAYPGESPVINMGKAFEPVVSTNISTSTGQFTTGRYGDIWATGDRVKVQARRFAGTQGGSVTQDSVGTLPTGFSTNTDYYVRRIDATHITLHPTATDATNNTNVIIPSDQGGTADTYTVLGGSAYPEFFGSPVYIDGVTFQNMPNKGLDFQNDVAYPIIRRCSFTTQYGGGESMNSAVIMTEGNGRDAATLPLVLYMVLHGNTFSTIQDSSFLKLYALYKPLIANNTYTTSVDGFTTVSEGIAMKGTSVQPTIRFNTISGVDGDALGGNNDVIYGGEYYHNLVYAPSSIRAVRINQDGAMSLPCYYYRNTFVGVVTVRDGIEQTLPSVTDYNWSAMADSDAGPFVFTNNVIINAQYTGTALSSITYDGTETGGTITMSANLQGVSADNIVDGAGALTGSYRTTYLGLRGYEVGTPAAQTYRIRRVRFL